jgi:hypothetical protein
MFVNLELRTSLYISHSHRYYDSMNWYRCGLSQIPALSHSLEIFHRDISGMPVSVLHGYIVRATPMHPKRKLQSYAQTRDNLRYPTRSSLYAYKYSISGYTHAKRAMQAASSHTVHHFSLRFLISYIVVMISPSSHIAKSVRANRQGSHEILLCAFIIRINSLTSSSSQGS